jgi:hypothetical protein
MPPVSVTMQALNLAEADALLAELGVLAWLERGELDELPDPQPAASTATRPSAIAFLTGPRTVPPLAVLHNRDH